ncbi:type II secretion system major pseudopilin GspG [Escherichia coli]|nr:type II secretion system major pseudopilin GspG [Escherichia coli]
MNSLSRTQKPRAGFTLLEVMVVIVILGVLASLVVPNLLGNKEKADRQKAISDIVALENALDMYRLDNGRYPTTEQGLEALIQQPANMADSVTTVPVDTLNDCQRSRGAMIISISARVKKGCLMFIPWGADGQENGEGAGADIGNWNLQEFQ